jgi:hypothetical protein
MAEALTQPGTSISHSKLEVVLAVVLEEAIDDAVELARVGGDAKLERRGLS